MVHKSSLGSFDMPEKNWELVLTYRVSHERQLVNSLFPHDVLDIKDFLQIISFKK